MSVLFDLYERHLIWDAKNTVFGRIHPDPTVLV
jgi:hypothetical protein